jgi:nicotinamide riboside transporter PnuC
MNVVIKDFLLRPGKRSVAYLLFALPLLLIALVGLQYGAFPLYAAPVVICIFQFFRPTMIGWLLIFLPCVAMCFAWLFGLVRDLAYIIIGARPSILLDLDDSLVFLVALALFLGFSWWLWRIRPAQPVAAQQLPQADG